MLTNSDIDVLSHVHLTKHFTLGEMLESSYLAWQSYPDAKQLLNLLYLCWKLEVVRTCLNRPIIITSGFRSAELNEKVGGVNSSAHTLGYAADFPCSEAEFNRLRLFVTFDQLIFYKKRCFCHIGLADNCRQQVIISNS